MAFNPPKQALSPVCFKLLTRPGDFKIGVILHYTFLKHFSFRYKLRVCNEPVDKNQSRTFASFVGLKFVPDRLFIFDMIKGIIVRIFVFF